MGAAPPPRPAPVSRDVLMGQSAPSIRSATQAAETRTTEHMSLTSSGVSSTGRTFSYGYDFDSAMTVGVWPAAEQRSVTVASTLTGTFEDVAIMGWGPGSPEVSPGVYNFTGIAKQLAFVEASGGIPVITLCGAPSWMTGGEAGTTNWALLGNPPLPQYYQAFATLSAAIAQAFPQVEYFAVWSELRGFWSPTTHSWDAAAYTDMYNDVYTAVKAVRPDAMVGGPYVSVHSLAGPPSVQDPTPSGAWGHLDPISLAAISYWLSNNVGADFVAVDGRAYTNNEGLTTDPLTSTDKYAAVDQWLSSQTSLPIVWMESHVLPDPTAYSQQQQAALRVATLLQMASSGASLGMQWNPVQSTGWDEGDWTTAALLYGGAPTVLAGELPAVMQVLAAPVTLVSGTPPGTLEATGVDGTVTVTYSATTGTVTVTPPAAS